MDKKLHLLDSLDAQGSDGQIYRLHAYEHLVRDPSAPDAFDAWEPTGQSEYRLADGRRVTPRADGSWEIPGSQVTLTLH